MRGKQVGEAACMVACWCVRIEIPALTDCGLGRYHVHALEAALMLMEGKGARATREGWMKYPYHEGMNTVGREREREREGGGGGDLYLI